MIISSFLDWLRAMLAPKRHQPSAADRQVVFDAFDLGAHR